MKAEKKRKGFTLIELLVVISIIGILASLAMVSYSGAQKQTRDTQRRSDLNQYRNALESFATVNNSMYPSSGGSDGTCGDADNLCGTGFSEFISDCPEDPLSPTRIYKYCSNVGGTYGAPNSTEYRLYTGGWLETGGAWVVCSDGRTGKVGESWGEITGFCPL